MVLPSVTARAVNLQSGTDTVKVPGGATRADHRFPAPSSDTNEIYGWNTEGVKQLFPENALLPEEPNNWAMDSVQTTNAGTTSGPAAGVLVLDPLVAIQNSEHDEIKATDQDHDQQTSDYLGSEQNLPNPSQEDVQSGSQYSEDDHEIGKEKWREKMATTEAASDSGDATTEKGFPLPNHHTMAAIDSGSPTSGIHLVGNRPHVSLALGSGQYTVDVWREKSRTADPRIVHSRDHRSIEVREAGLYMIYSQIFWHKRSGEASYVIQRSGDSSDTKKQHILAQCISAFESGYAISKSCYTSRVAVLRRNDQLELKILTEDLTVDFDVARSFFGSYQIQSPPEPHS